MNGLPSVFSLILYLFQFALAIFNPGAILLYLSFEKPIYMTLWYSCVCFAYGVSALYFSYGFHVLPCVSPGGIQFITTNMIIEFFFLYFLFPSLFTLWFLCRSCSALCDHPEGWQWIWADGQWRQSSVRTVCQRRQGIFKKQSCHWEQAE